LSVNFVIDSSVGFAWIHPAQATLETERLLESIEAGATVVVPDLWFLEVANGLLVLQRRKKITAADRKSALETLLALNLTVDADGGKAAFNETSDLAEMHGLTIYDAAYLELALRRKLPLASRDHSLVAAARNSGVKVL
jgi:predicted nucleic acid-binding protein